MSLGLLGNEGDEIGHMQAFAKVVTFPLAASDRNPTQKRLNLKKGVNLLEHLCEKFKSRSRHQGFEHS